MQKRASALNKTWKHLTTPHRGVNAAEKQKLTEDGEGSLKNWIRAFTVLGRVQENPF